MCPIRASLVVVGGGITGLSTAIAWALHRDPAREPVIVIEEQRTLGGCVTSFRRQGYLFDTAQIVPDVGDLLGYLGVDVPMERFADVCARLILVDPEHRSKTVVAIPASVEGFHDMLAGRYPHQRAAIDRFFDLSRAVFAELRHLKVEPRWYDLLSMPRRCRNIVAIGRLTYRQLVSGCGIDDPELCDVLDVFATFAGLPAERVAALLPVSAMMVSLAGAYRPKAGFVTLPYAMERRLEQLGGTVWTRQRVTRILTDRGRVTGVQIADGRTVLAERVVTTIDPVVAMRDLVGIEIVRARDRRYAARIESLRMSTSSMHISLGLDDEIDLRAMGLEGGYNVITTGRGTFARLFDAFDRGELGCSSSCFHTAVICPSLVTGGKPSVTIRVVPMPMADWGEMRKNDPSAYAVRKRSIADFFIELVERYAIADLRRHIQVEDIATPATFARYTGSLSGQNYDMAPYPDNFGRKRLPMRTPIAGLYQPKFSNGIWPCMMAGLQAVDMMLGGAVMHGYSRYSPDRDPPAPRARRAS